MKNGLNISKINIQKTYIFTVMIATVLMSKTYYFGVANRSIFQYFYYMVIVIGIVICKFKKRIYKKNLLSGCFLILLLGINLLIYQEEIPTMRVNQVITDAIFIFCAIVASGFISKSMFSSCYIRIMRILCLVSIPCCMLANINPDLAMDLCQSGYDWQVPVGYSFFYTWGWFGTIFTRNSGPFWEPGAFQGFIMLAMLLLLYETDKVGGYQQVIKKRKTTFILFVITLLSTQSTTGYILLIVLLLTQWKRIQNIYGNLNKIIRYSIVLLLSIASIYIILSSGNIAYKFMNLRNDSAKVRFADFFGGLLLIFKGGLFGLGNTLERDSLKVLVGVNINDSVGLFSMTYTYGILFGLAYLYCMYTGLKRYFDLHNFSEIIVFLMIFITLHMTEGLWNLPVYLTLIFVGFQETPT